MEAMKESKIIDINERKKKQLTQEEQDAVLGITRLTEYEIALLRKDKKDAIKRARKLLLKDSITLVKGKSDDDNEKG